MNYTERLILYHKPFAELTDIELAIVKANHERDIVNITKTEIDYNQYLKSEEWQARRRTALQKADGHCMICGRQRKLQVHHNSYMRLGDERESDLIVLCAGCHKDYHKKGKLLEPV